ncbi:unnamed protein product [Prorocentrum cordatum]|uniref:RING-type domain-containing protein n=1 Tax=Prorocentrum cordatum TaxID=2364126 RepID=A0ABN9X4D9_9DINO|nr:unnamed protein product [Polarella glacialis]
MCLARTKSAVAYQKLEVNRRGPSIYTILQGSALEIVEHLEFEEYDCEDGGDKLVELPARILLHRCGFTPDQLATVKAKAAEYMAEAGALVADQADEADEEWQSEIGHVTAAIAKSDLPLLLSKPLLKAQQGRVDFATNGIALDALAVWQAEEDGAPQRHVLFVVEQCRSPVRCFGCGSPVQRRAMRVIFQDRAAAAQELAQLPEGPASIQHFQWPPAQPRAAAAAPLDPLRRRLLSREGDFTPEDYELLLELDASQGCGARGSSSSAGAAQLLLARLPTRTVAEGPAQGQCSICLEQMATGEEVRTLPCMHVFHRGCIDRWLSMPGPPRCPIDQAVLEPA